MRDNVALRLKWPACLHWFFFLFVCTRAATLTHRLRAGSSENVPSKNTSSGTQVSFPQYVDSVTSGRGIWKWNNALVAYERHFSRFKNTPVKFGEVGLWAGGSILMWHAVFGAQCHVYGFDIMEAAMKYQDAKTTITVMDQGDAAAWAGFFQKTTPTLNVLVDDGGHKPHQMLTTTKSVWPHLVPGGTLAVEDIMGTQYLQEFFTPVAEFYGGAAQGQLASIHIYPLELIAEKVAPGFPPMDITLYPGAAVSARVNTFEALTAALHSAPAGSLVELQNPAWGNFLSTICLKNFFGYFRGLHEPVGTQDTPPGCTNAHVDQCVQTLVNNAQQDRIVGAHILPSKLIVEVAAIKPVIQAVRHGSWSTR